MDINFIYLDQIDSTQTFAKNNYKKFPPGKISCISAIEQTSGKGRYERVWISFKGKSILATFYLQLSKMLADLSAVGNIMAISAVELLETLKISAKIKWPNDILVNNKKNAGILTEIIFENDLAHVFLGIGMNINWDQKELSSIDIPATSLNLETNCIFDTKELLEKLAKLFLENLKKFKKDGFVIFQKKYEQHLAYKGEKISVFDGKKKQEGILDSISSHGELKLFLPDKKQYLLLSSAEIAMR